MPLFSVILVHYQGATPHHELLRGAASVRAQTFTDYELLAYHNGPLLDGSLPMPVDFRCSDQNQNDWGFANRDRGIREATGDYIVHLSSDNVLYPHCLQRVAEEIRRPPRTYNTSIPIMDNPQIVIYPIKMMGFMRVNHQLTEVKGAPYYMILSGSPPVPGNVDMMQLVMRRDLWLAHGGYFDRRRDGDGYMCQAFAQRYGYRSVSEICGEHH